MPWARLREWTRKSMVLHSPEWEQICKVRMLLTGTQEIAKETLREDFNSSLAITYRESKTFTNPGSPS